MYISVERDGSDIGTALVRVDEEKHLFDIWSEDNEARVTYQETLSWRGSVRTAEPPESVSRKLLQSDELSKLLDQENLSRATLDRKTY